MNTPSLIQPAITYPTVYPGEYWITPMGPQTTFRCLVRPEGEDVLLIDMMTHRDLQVSKELFFRMAPSFICKNPLVC